jgi:hypothetical protein
MHDENSDLHTFKDARVLPGFGLIHPHTRRGWLFLRLQLGEQVMTLHEAGSDPRVTLSHLDKILADAELDGLTVEETVAKPL